MDNNTIVNGSLIPSTKNAPLDARTRISTIAEVENISVPFVGMIFYVEDEQQFYKVLSLKAKKVGPVTTQNALIDEYELLINPNLATKEFVEEQIAAIELIPGEQGPQGEMGPQGPQGEQGPEGPMGPQGLEGPAGKDGVDGKDFTFDMFTAEQLEMLRGPQGEMGPEGPAGKDAEPVDLTGYATEDFVKAEIEKIEIPEFDTTELQERITALEEVDHSVFLTEHQDVSHLATKEEVEKLHQRKYEVSGVPEGTLVKYFDNEVRVMCPKDAEFHKQNVGAGGSANKYYMNFTMFAPEGAVTFREGTQGMTAAELVLEDELRTVENGKRTIWLSLAVFDEATGEWIYRGDESTVDRCIGWNVLVEWYDAEGKVIVRDSFRVNIANKECFDSVVPLYREGLANKEFVKEQIAAIELKEGPMGPKGDQGIQGEKGDKGEKGSDGTFDANAIFEILNTEDKTVLGAINELLGLINDKHKIEEGKMFFGYIPYEVTGDIASYADITMEMIKHENSRVVEVNAQKLDRTSVGYVPQACFIFVAVPAESTLEVKKDNGFGGKLPFTETDFGCNDLVVVYNEVEYRVFGEMTLASGERFIYIN
jgi:hypothetical protein